MNPQILFILVGFAIPIAIGAIVQGILLLFGIKLNGDGGDRHYQDSSSSSRNSCDDNSYTINPSTGSPMIGGMGGVDTFGNSFGSCSAGGCDD